MAAQDELVVDEGKDELLAADGDRHDSADPDGGDAVPISYPTVRPSHGNS
jgi:hypothetical protein